MSPPNILFMLNDHQAYYGHGLRGGVEPLRPWFQLRNLAREGTFRKTVAEMQERLRRWMERTGDGAALLPI
jgi:hypothetical protein